MLLDSILAKIAYKLFAFIFSVYCTFAGAVTPPSAEQTIKPSSDNAQLVFAAIADPQVSNYMPWRYKYFLSASEDLRNAEGLDAMLIAGDVAENGLAVEYQLFYDELSNLDLQYIACEGNHDIRLRLYSQSTKRFNGWLNSLNNNSNVDSSTFHYSTELNGIKFIIMGSDRTEFEENYINNEQLAWLDSELAEQNGKVTFVMVHQPLKNTHGLPDVWGSPFKSAGSIGDQSDDIYNILNKYNNVILLTGHEHTGFGKFTYEKIGNIDSINIPSLCCDNNNGENNDHGLGFIVEVYENSVLFRARDMCQGKWLPEYDITVNFD